MRERPFVAKLEKRENKKEYMKKKLKKIYLQQKKRALKKIIGSSERPRLSIYRSHLHIYAQLIDDNLGHTLVSSSTLEKNFPKENFKSSTKAASFEVGSRLALKAKILELNKIIFDKGKKPYHGRIEALAQGCRKQGLIF